MSRARIQFAFLSPWHVSNGQGAGPAVDNAVLRSPEGLPYVPGRAVKGLMRDAVGVAEEVGAVPSGSTRRLFGSDIEDQEPAADVANIAARYRTEEGALRFGNATLPDSWRLAAKQERSAGRARGDGGKFAADYPAWTAALVDVVAATALENGVAKEATLRTFEVAVPMTLSAPVEGPEDCEWLNVLREAAPFLRGVGARRHRGYGRVAIRIEEDNS